MADNRVSQFRTVSAAAPLPAVEINKVLRNTYMLLSLTLAFSAVTAVASMAMGTSHGVGLVCSIGAIAMLWLVLPRFANSAAGVGISKPAPEPFEAAKARAQAWLPKSA